MRPGKQAAGKGVEPVPQNPVHGAVSGGVTAAVDHGGVRCLAEATGTWPA